MNEHRFVLQPYRGLSSRFRCPKCQHRNKTFTRYIDLENYCQLADHVGRCDREDKCAYHYTPRQYFAENPHYIRVLAKKVCDAMPVQNLFNHLPASLMNGSMVQKAYIRNNFILFLAGIFGWEQALQAAEKYNIGTASHWHGATVFWQVDKHFKIRTGKIMLYDKETGKRVKTPFNHVAWAHSLVCSRQFAVGSNEQLPVGSGQLAVSSGQTKKETANSTPKQTVNRPLPTANFHLEQCFFGEHLLWLDENAVVGITESEKTAVMASIMMPGFIWLAAGSLHGLDPHKCKALKNRTVLLFPDVGAYDNWLARARELNLKIPTATFAVHDEMEKTATDEERANGADMGDRWVGEWLGARSGVKG